MNCRELAALCGGAEHCASAGLHGRSRERVNGAGSEDCIPATFMGESKRGDACPGIATGVIKSRLASLYRIANLEFGCSVNPMSGPCGQLFLKSTCRNVCPPRSFKCCEEAVRRSVLIHFNRKLQFYGQKIYKNAKMSILIEIQQIKSFSNCKDMGFFLH